MDFVSVVKDAFGRRVCCAGFVGVVWGFLFCGGFLGEWGVRFLYCGFNNGLNFLRYFCKNRS